MPDFLYSFASVRKTYYFNTSRPSEHVTVWWRWDSILMLNRRIQRILLTIDDPYRDTRIFDFVGEELDNVSRKCTSCTIIVDNFSFFLNLNVSRGLKEWLLIKLYNTSKFLKNLIYIYVMKDVHPPEISNLVIDVSDVVFDLDVEKIGDKVYRRLSIPKIRGKTSFVDTFRYYVREGVVIDTSRDIA